MVKDLWLATENPTTITGFFLKNTIRSIKSRLFYLNKHIQQMDNERRRSPAPI